MSRLGVLAEGKGFELSVRIAANCLRPGRMCRQRVSRAARRRANIDDWYRRQLTDHHDGPAPGQTARATPGMVQARAEPAMAKGPER
jgi:hypothetical protein